MTFRLNRSFTLLCGLLFALICGSGHLHAAPTAKVTVGFGNTYRVGAWNPVTVTLSNLPGEGESAADLREYSGRLEFETENNSGSRFLYHKPVVLPPNSNQQFVFYARLGDLEKSPSSIVLRRPNGIKVEEWDVDLLLTSKRLVPAKITDQEKLILVVEPSKNPQPFELSPFNQLQPFVAQRITAAEFPNRYLGLDGVDLVLIEGLDRKDLDSDQWESLRKWTELGGRVVFLGGLYSESYYDLPVQSMLPVEVLGVTDTETTRGGRERREQLTDWKLLDGAKILLTDTEAHTPRGAYRPYGNGEVHFWAFGDAMRRPDWQLLYTALRQNPQDLFEKSWEWDFRSLLSIDEGSILDFAGQPPSIIIILILLGIYCLIVGPLNFRYLYKNKKLEYAWLTIPAIVAAFSIGIYLAGLITMGRTAYHREYHLLLGEANQPVARQLSYAAAFTPNTRSYRVRALAQDDVATMLPQTAKGSFIPQGLETIGGVVDGYAYQGLDTWNSSPVNPAAFGQMFGGGGNFPVDEGLPPGFELSETPESMMIDDLLIQQWDWRLVQMTGQHEWGDDSNAAIKGDIYLWDKIGTSPGHKLQGELYNRLPYGLKNVRFIQGEQYLVQKSWESGAKINLGGLRARKLPIYLEPASERLSIDEPENSPVHQAYESFLRIRTTHAFPRGKLFLLAEVDRPTYQAINFDGANAAFEPFSFLVMEVPMKLANRSLLEPGMMTMEPVKVEAYQPEYEAPFARMRNSSSVQMQEGEIVYRVEAPFDPGTTIPTTLGMNFSDESMVQGMGTGASGASLWSFRGSVYDFGVQKFTPISLSTVSTIPSQLPETTDWLPDETGVGFLRIATQKRPGNTATKPQPQYYLQYGNLAVGGQFTPNE